MSQSSREVMKELEGLGTDHTRRTYARHGVTGKMFGVKRVDLYRIRKRIGKVEVDHGDTSCKTPDAVSAMEKGFAHRRGRAAKKAKKAKKARLPARLSVILLVVAAVHPGCKKSPGREVRTQVTNAPAKTTAAPPDAWARLPGARVKARARKITRSGLEYYVMKEGSGKTPAPTNRVRVHYTGWFPGGKKFDSSVDRGEPAVFPVNRVIPGWTEGLQLMRKGAKYKFVIPGRLAYGDNPRAGYPAGTLVFDVELIEVIE